MPNPVCRDCAASATTPDGEPIEGLPSEPADDEPSLTPCETGPNPVIVDGARCWRTGSDDAWQLSRDALDCDSCGEFVDRHTDTDGNTLAWFAPDPAGGVVQTRIEPDSAPALTAFVEQFDGTTPVRIELTATASSPVPTDQPAIGLQRVDTATPAASAPTFEATLLTAEPQPVRFELPAIDRVTVVDATTLPTFADREPAMRAAYYRTLAATAPELVDIDALRPLLTAADPQVRYTAVRTVETVVDVSPTAGLGLVDALADRLADRELTALYAVRSLIHIAEQHPESVADAAGGLTGCIDTGDSLLATASTRLLLYIAEHDPAAAIDATPALASLLSPTPTRARRQALATLSMLAEPYPEEVRPLVPQLCSLLQTDDAQYRISCTAALGRVTAEYPDAAAPAVPTLLDQLAMDDAELRGNAVGVLGDIAQRFPTDIAPYAEELGPMLDDDDPTVRSNTAGTLARIADEKPRHVREFVPDLIELLEDSWLRSRVHACWALGYCGDDSAVDALDDARHTDPSEAVRDRAAWALDRIE
ncbi:MAG: hypothetical protein A07HN63_00388 [uncultured archaeon A07HN63]|nr:MAG: hypothetical protein A07HN63_00388 [uncultured archaeon A07HN63]